MRDRGMVGHVMVGEDITGPWDRYALFVRPDGEMRMVHSEGVSYVVREDKPWKWNDYSEDCPSYSVEELLLVREGCREVDLADWIRTFGARLETNFQLTAQWWRAGE